MYDSMEIKCPNCEAMATFEEPFKFLSSNEADPDETRPCHQWGGWLVIERFPSQFKWKAPSASSPYRRGDADNGSGGYPLLTYGLVRCAHCHTNKKHKLSWPDDAYWQWDIRGELLWARDRAHAKEILAFVKKAVRPARRSNSLRHIPSHFLSSKVRDLVVQKMEKSLVS
jgi:hypothetical protein